MKERQLFKKGLAVILALSMLVGLIPGLGNAILEVKAAANVPSVSTFATKEQLMSEFSLENRRSRADTQGYINFAKDSSGKTVKWYVVGKDSGISKDNVILFASSPMLKNVAFENDNSHEKTYSAAWGCTYTVAPRSVYPNHYGSSDIRVVLKGMIGADNTSYFSKAEQRLMNTTTIVTTDTKNSREYSLSDKLYLAEGDYSDYDYIWLGSNDDVRVYKGYWGTDALWLRTGYVNYDNYGLVASPGHSLVGCSYVNNGFALQPVFNLDLSSVLFASAVDAATVSDTEVYGQISADVGMNLKMDGSVRMSDTKIRYKSDVVSYEAAVGDRIVVQGNDGINDWYYSRYVEGETTTGVVPAVNIRTDLNLSEVPDFNNCKIWIERTETDTMATDYGMVYAVMASKVTEEERQTIHFIDIEVDAPVSGKVFDATAVSQTAGVATATIIWSDAEGNRVSETVAKHNKNYTLKATVAIEKGYNLAENLAVSVNGNAVKSADIVKNSDGTVTITYTFDATGKIKITSVDVAGLNLPAEYRFAKLHTAVDVVAPETTELPDTIGVTVEDGSVTSMKISWEIEGTYNIASNATNIFVWKIEASEYQNKFDTNNQTLTGKVAIVNILSEDRILLSTVGNYKGIYDGQPHSIQLEVSSPEGTTITYSTDGQSYSNIKPQYTDVGEYPVYYKIEKENYDTVKGWQKVVIEKREVTIAPVDQKIMWGESLDQSKYVLSGIEDIEDSGLVTGEALQEVNLIPSTTKITGEGTITVSGVKIVGRDGRKTTGNYKINYTTGKLAIVHNTLLPPISLKVSKPQLKYKTGDILNVDDIFVEATYADGFSELITNFQTNVAEIDMTTEGEKTLVVSYGKNGASVSENISITVEMALMIVSQPERVEIQAGNSATFKVEAKAVDVITYQWMVNKGDGSGWAEIPDATSNEYVTPSTNVEDSGYMYKCRVKSGIESKESSEAILTVKPIPVDIGIDASVAHGNVIDVSKYFLIDENAGAPTYTLVPGTGTGVGTLADTILTVTKTGTFVVRLTTAANGNYAEGKAIATITVSDEKAVVCIVAGYEGTYDGEAHSISLEVVSMEDALITYSDDITEDKVYSEEKPEFTEAGEYTIYYKVEKANFETVTGFQKVVIVPRKITITANDQSITWNGTLNQEEFDLTGYKITSGELVDGDSMEQVVLSPVLNFTSSLIHASDAVILNEFDEDVTANYSITYVSGELTLEQELADMANVPDVSEDDGMDGVIDDDSGREELEGYEEDWEYLDNLEVYNADAKYKVNILADGDVEVTYVAPKKKSATSVTIPSTVTLSDGTKAKVTAIGARAFKGNKKLTKIVIGKNIKTIGKQAFYGCKNLKKVSIKTKKLTKKSVGSKAFKGIYEKAEIKVPKAKIKLYTTVLKAKGIGKDVVVKK